MLFHPVDTIAKRLMSNQSVAIKGQPRAEALSSLNQVPFCFAANATQGVESSR